MGLRVNTNIPSLGAQRNLSDISMRLQNNYSRLSSGLRISRAADDAAGLGISERMRAQIRSLGAASRNAQDGVSLVQTAEGALNEVSNNLTRIRELAIQAANGTLASEDRAVIDSEVNALITEIDRIANSTEFNGLSLLDSTNTIDFQIGIDAGDVVSVTLESTTVTDLGLSGVGVDTSTNASNALATLDAAIDAVTMSRGELGAAENRMLSSMRSILNYREQLSAAESRIRDVDIASETADLTRNSIMQQAAVSILGQANLQPQVALSLLQG